MANLQAFLKIICKHGMSLSEATEIINDLVTDNTMDGKFITFFWGVFDNKDLTFNYVNAGHNPPLLIRKKKIIKLNKGGIILGVMKTFTPYESPTISLEKDDIIVLFTDGITEAMNKHGEEFSDERLEELVLKSSGSYVLKRLLKISRIRLRDFAAGTIQSDDITLLVVKGEISIFNYMNKLKNFIARNRQKLIIISTIFLFIIGIFNFFFVYVKHVTSNDECLWVPKKNGIIFDKVKVNGVTWNAGIRNGDQLISNKQ